MNGVAASFVVVDTKRQTIVDIGSVLFIALPWKNVMRVQVNEHRDFVL